MYVWLGIERFKGRVSYICISSHPSMPSTGLEFGVVQGGNGLVSVGEGVWGALLGANALPTLQEVQTWK